MVPIERISNRDVPISLLLLADEDEGHINQYRDTAVFWAARAPGGEEILGIIGLSEEDREAPEIKCVAVKEEVQNRGIGRALVETAIAYSKKQGFRELYIKTGNCGIAQLYLYQSCGFRFHSINRDYFRSQYPVPIYENSLACLDQIVLEYRIYSETEQQQNIEAYWQRFLKNHPAYTGRCYQVWSFAYGEHLPNKLIALVKEGKKRATASARELYGEEEKLPEPGDLAIITDGNGLPGCIVKTTEVVEKKFIEVTEEEARLEGEGDGSLRFWREAHENFFKMEYQEVGKTFSHDSPVLLQKFEVIYDEDRWG